MLEPDWEKAREHCRQGGFAYSPVDASFWGGAEELATDQDWREAAPFLLLVAKSEKT